MQNSANRNIAVGRTATLNSRNLALVPCFCVLHDNERANLFRFGTIRRVCMARRTCRTSTKACLVCHHRNILRKAPGHHAINTACLRCSAAFIYEFDFGFPRG
jgi:hypothetical protein